ncbi:histone H1.8 [Monodelphis domestica]|uniref:histone H1.8 n=1 Tax=Monodelphis domestica TaxID=13616 RepID=UPI0024E26726|nr:histone H1.8 [Monodelphis domestica]
MSLEEIRNFLDPFPDDVALNLTLDLSSTSNRLSSSSVFVPDISTETMNRTSDIENSATSSVQPELPGHPSTLQMVTEALKARGDKHGTSVAAIKFYICRKYPAINMRRFRYLLKQALAKGISDGVLVRPRNSTVTGARGKFKLVSKNKAKAMKTKKLTVAIKPRKKKATRSSEAGNVSLEASTKRKAPATKKKVPEEALTKKKAPATKKKVPAAAVTKKTVPVETSTKRKTPATKKKVPAEAPTKRKTPTKASTKRRVSATKKVFEEALTKRKAPATKKMVPAEAPTKRKTPTEASTKRRVSTTKKVPQEALTKRKVLTTKKKDLVEASTKKKVPKEAQKDTKVEMAKGDSKPKDASSKKDVEEVRAKARGTKPKAEIPKGKKKASISPKKVAEEHKTEKTKLQEVSEANPKARRQRRSSSVHEKDEEAAAMSKAGGAGGAKEIEDEPKTAPLNKGKLDVDNKPSTSQSKVSRELDTAKDEPKSKGKKSEASKVIKKPGKSPQDPSSKPASKKAK